MLWRCELLREEGNPLARSMLAGIDNIGTGCILGRDCETLLPPWTAVEGRLVEKLVDGDGMALLLGEGDGDGEDCSSDDDDCDDDDGDDDD